MVGLVWMTAEDCRMTAEEPFDWTVVATAGVAVEVVVTTFIGELPMVTVARFCSRFGCITACVFVGSE